MERALLYSVICRSRRPSLCSSHGHSRHVRLSDRTDVDHQHFRNEHFAFFLSNLQRRKATSRGSSPEPRALLRVRRSLLLFCRYSRVVFHGDSSPALAQRLSPRGYESPRSLAEPGSPVPSFLEAIDHSESEKSLRKREAPFQQLDFLVRDWQNFRDEESVEACLEEMEAYKTQLFAPRGTADLRETREQIDFCYQNVDIFCLPHPGTPVTRMNFSGNIREVEPSFLSLLGLYIEHIFATRLQPKIINHSPLYAADFEE